MTVGAAAAALAIGVALGSIPSGWIVVRRRTGRDLSSEGSGTVGALNAMRVTRSPITGVLVLLLDAAKGVAAVLLARTVVGDEHAGLVAAVGAIAGHDYNPWLSLARGRLAGGKGFATAGGALAVLAPWLIAVWLTMLLVVGGALFAAARVRDEAPASAAATVALIPASAVLYGTPEMLMSLGMAALILPKHARELRTLLRPPPP